MTREEIISNLLYMKRSVKEDTIEDRTIDEAIAALKAEPCEDAVSRQAVLDALRTCFDTDSVYDVINGIDYIDYDEAVNEVLDLPPVTPKQKWIPVDYDRYPETYPKAFQEVWITDGYGEVEHKAYDGTRNIKAWMPYIIPEPYKAESEDKNDNNRGIRKRI